MCRCLFVVWHRIMSCFRKEDAKADVPMRKMQTGKSTSTSTTLADITQTVARKRKKPDPVEQQPSSVEKQPSSMDKQHAAPVENKPKSRCASPPGPGEGEVTAIDDDWVDTSCDSPIEVHVEPVKEAAEEELP